MELSDVNCYLNAIGYLNVSDPLTMSYLRLCELHAMAFAGNKGTTFCENHMWQCGDAAQSTGNVLFASFCLE